MTKVSRGRPAERARLRTIKLALLLLCLVGVAEAGAIKPPAGWTADPALAASVAQKAGKDPHFGGLRGTATAEAFRAPDGKGALYVTRIAANVSEAQRDRAATAELDELTAVLQRQNTKPETYREEAKQRTLSAFVVFGVSGVTTWSQIVIAGDAQQLVAVTGECILNSEASKELKLACTTALAGLEAGIDLAARVELRVVREPPPPAAGSAAPTAPSSPRLGEGVILPPHQIPTDRPKETREADRRPIYVGAGLIVFAVVFWWNRKRREKFEKEDSGEPAKPAKTRRPRDADADDLHAAAEETVDNDQSPHNENKS